MNTFLWDVTKRQRTETLFSFLLSSFNSFYLCSFLRRKPGPVCVTVFLDNINWRDVQRKNVVNNVDMSSLRAPWKMACTNTQHTERHKTRRIPWRNMNFFVLAFVVLIKMLSHIGFGIGVHYRYLWHIATLTLITSNTIRKTIS